MKKLGVLFAVLALFVAGPAFAASVFKVEPATEAEKEVGKALEAFATKHSAGDARGASELYTEDAVYKYFYGTQNEPKTAEGRMKIYIVYSFGQVTGVKYHDMLIRKVDGDKAEATGSYVLRATAFGLNFRRSADRAWKLRRDTDGQWRIYLDETLNAVMTRD